MRTVPHLFEKKEIIWMRRRIDSLRDDTSHIFSNFHCKEVIPEQSICTFIVQWRDVQAQFNLMFNTHISQTNRLLWSSYHFILRHIYKCFLFLYAWNTKCESCVPRRNPIAPLHYLSSDSSFIVGSKSILRDDLLFQYIYLSRSSSSSSAQRMHNALERRETVAVRGLNYKMLLRCRIVHSACLKSGRGSNQHTENKFKEQHRGLSFCWWELLKSTLCTGGLALRWKPFLYQERDAWLSKGIKEDSKSKRWVGFKALITPWLLSKETDSVVEVMAII